MILCWIQNGAGKERDACIRKMAPKSRAGARSRHWLCFVRAAGGEVDAAPVGEKVNKDICACFRAAAGMFRTAALSLPPRIAPPGETWYNDTIYIYREKGLFQPYDRLQTSADAGDSGGAGIQHQGILRYYQRNARGHFPGVGRAGFCHAGAHSESRSRLFAGRAYKIYAESRTASAARSDWELSCRALCSALRRGR